MAGERVVLWSLSGSFNQAAPIHARGDLMRTPATRTTAGRVPQLRGRAAGAQPGLLRAHQRGQEPCGRDTGDQAADTDGADRSGAVAGWWWGGTLVAWVGWVGGLVLTRRYLFYCSSLTHQIGDALC